MRFILSVLFFLLINITLSAQKVGVVLSGGGAKGLYHVGIIKALEENGIPIDYITGTSMGSIVAGLYAAGYSPEEMEDIFKNEDVASWVTGKIDDRYLYYFKKLDPRPSMVGIDFGIDRYLKKKQEKRLAVSSPVDIDGGQNPKSKKIHLNNEYREKITPASLVSSTLIDIALLDFFSGATARCRNNFDSLFVPFRCVSVDIYTRKEVLWKNGDLGMAIRSSMSIPLIFKPVEVDSMLMYDGGLLNNFPWKETVDEFNPDFIIGGKCVSGKMSPNSIQGQVEMLVMSETNYDMTGTENVMIGRDLNVSMLDFKKNEQVMAQGYQDAMLMMPEIKQRIARRVGAREIYDRRMRFKESVPDLVFGGFDIKGVTPKQREYIEGQLDIDKDSLIEFDTFKSEYYKILSEGVLDAGFPTAVYNDTLGLFRLNLKVNAKPSFKAMVGFNISSTTVNQGYVGLQYRDVGAVSSVYMFDGHIGSYYSAVQLGSRYNFYRNNPFYVESYISYNYYDYARGTNQKLTYRHNNLGYSSLNDFYISSLIGSPVGRASKIEFRLALGINSFGYFQNDKYETYDNPDKSNFKFVNISAALKRNSLDYVMYPTKGLVQTMSVFGVYTGERFHGGTTSSPDLVNKKISTKRAWIGAKFFRDDYFDFAKHFACGYSIEAMYSNQPDMYNAYVTKMVGDVFSPTPHSQTLYMPEFRDKSYSAVGLKPIFKFNDKVYLKTEGYCYFPNLESYVNVGSKLRYIISASAVYQSPIGPVSLSYSHYDITGLKRDYFTLNIGYLIFNRRGIAY